MLGSNTERRVNICVQVEPVAQIVSQIPIVNFLFLGANTYMMLNIKLAISNIQTKIAEDRMKDKEELRAWTQERLDSHSLKCFTGKP